MLAHIMHYFFTTRFPVKYDQNSVSENQLFNLKDDPMEQNNIIDNHPEVVKKLSIMAENARNDLGDNLTNTKGSGVRDVGIVKM